MFQYIGLYWISFIYINIRYVKEESTKNLVGIGCVNIIMIVIIVNIVILIQRMKIQFFIYQSKSESIERGNNMTVADLLEELNKVEDKNRIVIIDMIDRIYSSFDFHVDRANSEFVYLVNDDYVE